MRKSGRVLGRSARPQNLSFDSHATHGIRIKTIRTPWHNKDHADRTQNVTAALLSYLWDTTLVLAIVVKKSTGKSQTFHIWSRQTLSNRLLNTSKD